MKLIVGLGNPGADYARTRHNAGFMAIDRLASRHGLCNPKSKFHAGMLEGPIAGDKCVLLQPTTYMNRSGLTVAEAVAFYKLQLSDLLIVVDDIALPVGRLRIRASGSAGGHNGLADVERALGTPEYPRLRIGIDAPNRVRQHDYVLGRFSPDQLLKLNPFLDITANAIESWIKDGITKAMTLYNAGES